MAVTIGDRGETKTKQMAYCSEWIAPCLFHVSISLCLQSLKRVTYEGHNHSRLLVIISIEVQFISHSHAPESPLMLAHPRCKWLDEEMLYPAHSDHLLQFSIAFRSRIWRILVFLDVETTK